MTQRIEPEESAEAGFTLVEMLVSVTLVTGAIFALLGMLTSSLLTHRGQRDEAGAERVASTQIETARSLSFASLAPLSSLPAASVPIPGPHGLVYNTSTTIRPCSVADRGNACTTPDASNPPDLHVDVHVSWSERGQQKSLDVTTGITNVASSTLAGAGSTTIGNLIGGTSASAPPVTASVSNLSVTPASGSVDGQGHPLSTVTVSATVIGPAPSISFPVTWTDDAGSHQAVMSNSQGGTTWSATLKTTDITRVLTPGQSGTVTFTATVPGSRAIPSTTLSLSSMAAPTLSCAITPVAIVLSPLTTKTSLPTTLSCTATSLAATDVVNVSYLLASGRTSAALTTGNGTSWSTVIPAGTALPKNALAAFTFTGTRTLDSATVSTTATAAVA